jgi:hypothetical protein
MARSPPGGMIITNQGATVMLSCFHFFDIFKNLVIVISLILHQRILHFHANHGIYNKSKGVSLCL